MNKFKNTSKSKPMNKQQQLVVHIAQQIQAGTLVSGQKLPSIRSMAQTNQCSPSTVIGAYEQLMQERWIYAMDRSGYYVAQQGYNQQRYPVREQIDLSSAAPAPELFPYDDFQSCLNQATHVYRDQLFSYGMPQGLPPLLCEVRQQLEEVQVFARESQLFVTSGIQRALSILTMMPFPNGRQTIMIEQPSYHLLIELLGALHVPVEGVERTVNGLDWERIETLFQSGEIKFFYVIPRFHNPLGTSLSTADKKRLVALAAKYDVYIVEDDYLSDLEHSVSNDPMYAYDTSEHIIYLKSYSKILFPGLRIGVAVLPAALIDTFAQYKRLLDIDSSVLSQAALHMYIKNGMFTRYRRYLLEGYDRRIKQLHRTLDVLSADPIFAHAPRNQAVHTFLRLPDNFPTSVLIRRLAQQNIIVGDGSQHFLPDSPYTINLLRMNVSNVPEEQIDHTLNIIAKEIRKLSITPKLYE
ncbi:DNA-binding transcriptional MocR family regulator [Paenibacillus sp. SORGH_AS306]|uniref:aminotransferase-like domain-containing protein n=1 Tax=unclassified Paenibacillus TaxID=185978 RepID=UPI002784E073|nr:MULTISPECIES: PLP-dependent aminotransferase family protein [unclassified Paenibacillus]MDQ1237157.1 DNA-binding transcriptional MocR family regulator [Paenibacillus sp. SORGH_AS_0306]MDR6109516.1 DNA-binding transcriptional MocR family regulator [Paenibacillus sp. SORGH_AS_0338]